MLYILRPVRDENLENYRKTFKLLERLKDIKLQTNMIQGIQYKFTEIHLIDNTAKIDIEDISTFPVIENVIWISHDFRILGKYGFESPSLDSKYIRLQFNQESFNKFNGLCALYILNRANFFHPVS
jgi:3-deoxy-7-phosphoheptulonate synthase